MSAATVAVVLPSDDLKTLVHMVKGQIIAVEHQISSGLIPPDMLVVFNVNLAKAKSAFNALARAMTPADDAPTHLVLTAPELMQVELGLDERIDTLKDLIERDRDCPGNVDSWTEQIEIAEKVLTMVHTS